MASCMILHERLQKISEKSQRRMDRVAIILGLTLLIASGASYFVLEAFGQQDLFTLECPAGAYHGLDNQGNEACRDILTNEILEPESVIIIDSDSEKTKSIPWIITNPETGEIILNDDQTSIVEIIILALIGTVGGIIGLSVKKGKFEIFQRKKIQEKFVTVNSHKIRFLEAGDSKKVVVLVHGLGASAERWNGIIPEFSKKFRVIVPDLLGFGYSEKPIVDYTPQFFARSLYEFLENIGINKTSLIGSSLGGLVVAEFASTYPKKIDKIILVSPAGMMKQPTPALAAYISAALYPTQKNVQNAFQMMTTGNKKIPSEVTDNFKDRMLLPNAKMSFISTLLGLKNANEIAETLSRITVPTLILWGKKDRVIPIKYADDFVKVIKNCKYIKMKGCGHTPYVEDPKRFARIALDFLGCRTIFWLRNILKF